VENLKEQFYNYENETLEDMKEEIFIIFLDNFSNNLNKLRKSDVIKIVGNLDLFTQNLLNRFCHISFIGFNIFSLFS
jgi:hypothetical protein